MRRSKAERFNRMMMVGMFFMAVVVLGCCYVFLYMSFDAPADNNAITPNGEYIPQEGDSIILVIDSTYADVQP